MVVPLVVDADKNPDFGVLDHATAAIGAGLRRGTLVIYETTLPVGTTRRGSLRRSPRAPVCGSATSCSWAFSPERVYSGRGLRRPAPLPEAGRRHRRRQHRAGDGFYESALQFDDRDDLVRPNGVWNLGTTEAAELAKLAETTYRDINIGFANELARLARPTASTSSR